MIFWLSVLIEAWASVGECSISSKVEAATVLSPTCSLLFPSPVQDRDLPLIVFLHGLGSSAGEMATSPAVVWLQEQMKEGRFPSSHLLVMEGEQGYWTDWLDGRAEHRYEQRILEAVDEVVGNHPIAVEKIALVGISMGGFGALSVGLRHPDVFSAMVALSPTDMELAVQAQPTRSLYTQVYGDPIHLPYVAARNPRELIIRGAGQDQLLAWAYGTAEPDKFRVGAERLQCVAEVNELYYRQRIVQGGTHSAANTWGPETTKWWSTLLSDWFGQRDEAK